MSGYEGTRRLLGLQGSEQWMKNRQAGSKRVPKGRDVIVAGLVTS